MMTTERGMSPLTPAQRELLMNIPLRADERDALTALLAATAPQWQDMATCPSGTMVLLCSMEATEARHWCYVDWLVDGKLCAGVKRPKPTHWQNLPAPPEKGEQTMTPSTLFGNLHSLRVHLDVQRRDMKAGVSRDVLDDHIEALNEVIEALSPRGSVAALAVLRAPEGGTHGCKVTKEFTCELDPETVRAMRPLPTPPPADLVAMVQEWRIAQAAWIEEETDATANRLGKAEHALLAWTPAAPVPAQANNIACVAAESPDGQSALHVRLRTKPCGPERRLDSGHSLAPVPAQAGEPTLAIVSQALDALECDATDEQRRQAWDALRDEFYPLAAPPVAQEPGDERPVLKSCARCHGALLPYAERRFFDEGTMTTLRAQMCSVCGKIPIIGSMLDELMDAPQEPPTIEIGDRVTWADEDSDTVRKVVPAAVAVPYLYVVTEENAALEPSEVIKIERAGVVIWRRPTPGETR